ncbi:hypothetical protein CANINC_003250 [Pichia inconspicua]|uniref:CRAL-TRIO domain-containing protein n=1 Tax=Pichia inconspicua TaxID=52247 RepID=A0A4T0WZ51_9ASCO|nr:hypothetical protein CANINC_003250 [[Candida] inconspicua]
MTVTTPPGRISTLTDDQEHVLKQVWMYLLHFTGYTVNQTGPLVTHEHVPNPAAKKKGGLFGKLKRKKEEDQLTRVLSHNSSIDPAVRHTTDIKVHHALKGLDAKSTEIALWDSLRQDNIDNFILRFVRARKWDIDNTLLMLAHSIEWRYKESKVDEILRNGELHAFLEKKEGVIKQFKSGKCIIHGKDKKGRPIVIVRPRYHFSSEQTFEEIEIFTLLLIEYARLMLDEPIDQCTLIFDLHGFTMANMDYDPVKYMIKAFEAHYPESLGILLIHRAPWIFNGIWQIVKNWLDPVVASKINFTKNVKDLEKWIDPSQLIEELGGTDTWEYNYLQPTPEHNGLAEKDEQKQKAVTEERERLKKEFIKKTIEWIESTDLPTSKKLLQEKMALSDKLSENYRIFDGCIRNRGFYDRVGDIKL